MTTLMVSMSLDPTRLEEVRHHLTVDVIGWARQQPGFVGGRWCQNADGTIGVGLVDFVDTKSAQSAAHGPRGQKDDATRAWNITQVDLIETVATA